MSAISTLNIIDWSTRLPNKGWIIGNRSLTNAITIHYNGPAVSTTKQSGEGLFNQLVIDANYQMQPGGVGSPDGAPHIMYHYAVAADGQIYKLCNPLEILWHSGDSDGNAHSLAVHLPLGGSQDATKAQWDSTVKIINALRTDWKITDTSRIKGHKEWPQSSTACPGTLILPRIVSYRYGETHTGGVGKIRTDVALANIREGPSTAFPVALGGKAVMYPGDTLVYDVIIQGQSIGGDDRWFHRTDQLGFVSGTLVVL